MLISRNTAILGSPLSGRLFPLPTAYPIATSQTTRTIEHYPKPIRPPSQRQSACSWPSLPPRAPFNKMSDGP
ncbi:hypothetical protein BJX96DRAFT_154767 [Aspergillus floccosus]